MKRVVAPLLSAMFVAGLVGVSAQPAVAASGGGCSDWGPGGWAGTYLKACIVYKSGSVVATGQVRDSPGAITWIEICEHLGPCQPAVMGNTVTQKLPAGSYETVFYFGDGSGAQTSPVLKI